MLYIVATPIGNLNDITLRALETLKNVDLIAAEDTRQSKKLLEHYGIKTSLISLHDYNEDAQSEVLLKKLSLGINIALISDAGTPLISDPGFKLVQKVRLRNIKVVPIPGASALIAALSASGLPTNRFVFEGFLPVKHNELKKRLEELKNESRTIIFYESPHRIVNTLSMMCEIFEDRYAILARELTKIFETIHGAPLPDLTLWVKNDLNQQKGEMVLLIHGADKVKQENINEDAARILKILLKKLPGPEAIKLTMEILDHAISRKTLYQMVLGLKNNTPKIYNPTY